VSVDIFRFCFMFLTCMEIDLGTVGTIARGALSGLEILLSVAKWWRSGGPLIIPFGM